MPAIDALLLEPLELLELLELAELPELPELPEPEELEEEPSDEPPPPQAASIMVNGRAVRIACLMFAGAQIVLFIVVFVPVVVSFV